MTSSYLSCTLSTVQQIPPLSSATQLFHSMQNSKRLMASTPLLSNPTIATPKSLQVTSSFSPKQPQHTFPSKPTPHPSKPITTKLYVSSSPTSKQLNSTTLKPSSKPTEETIFFDGGAHYGDLLANLVLGFTLLWLPLTLAAVSRAFFLRYRFTNLRVTVISGLTGQDRSDFSYKVIKNVQVVPRFIGEWGDIVITLKDGTVVDLRSVPKFREIAQYCLSMAGKSSNGGSEAKQNEGPKGF